MKQTNTIKNSIGTFDRVANRISLINRRGSIQLRWTFSGKRYHLAIPGGISKAAIAAAYAKANAIAADIALNQFDATLFKYDSEKGGRIKRRQSEETIATLWEKYKEKKRQTAALTTQKSVWREIDRAIAALPPSALKLENIAELGNHYLNIRSANTAHRHFISLQSAIRVAIPGIKLKEQLPKMAKKPIQFFFAEEVHSILKAFQGNHYQRYVTFLAATGCRPEEAIALTPADISSSAQETECTISKVFSKGILRPYTKNSLERTVPLSDLASQTIAGGSHQLIFPSPTGQYIDQHNFLNREWRPLVTGMVEQGQLRRYLPSYALRHSFISNMLYRGVALPTIAWLVGDRVDTVLQFYAGIQTVTSSELPNLYD